MTGAWRPRCRRAAAVVAGSTVVKAGPISEVGLASTSPASHPRRRLVKPRRQRRASRMTPWAEGLGSTAASGMTADLAGIRQLACPAISRAQISLALESAVATTKASGSERVRRGSRLHGATRATTRLRGGRGGRIWIRSTTRSERWTSTCLTGMASARRRGWTMLSGWSIECTSPPRLPDGWRRSWCESEVTWSASLSAGGILAASYRALASALKLPKRTVDRSSWIDRGPNEISAIARIPYPW
mmetsp:Transcript_20688/g.46021  ORF Transcript_20688/g.46021 Transcript_20688/m.46021 type:complete len:245 (+) Transcript_20688:915-1649(+)